MPGTQPRVTKRKALNHSKANGPVKLQRTTLDAFFAPRQTVPSLAVEENPAVKEPSNKIAPEQKLAKGSNVGLSTEQEKVLRMVVDDERSIFFTGSAGWWRDFSKIDRGLSPNTMMLTLIQGRVNHCY